MSEDDQEVAQAVRLLREEGAYRVTIGGRIHCIVVAELVIGMDADAVATETVD